MFNLIIMCFLTLVMDDIDYSDVCSDISDVSFLSEFENDCQSINFDLSDGSPINMNNFNIAHYNINSVTAFGRLDQLADICAT